mgnify:CR=1 FL=1
MAKINQIRRLAIIVSKLNSKHYVPAEELVDYVSYTIRARYRIRLAVHCGPYNVISERLKSYSGLLSVMTSSVDTILTRGMEAQKITKHCC